MTGSPSPGYQWRIVLDGHPDSGCWIDVADGYRDWETVFAGYTAAVDNPACCVWQELLAANPEAKGILSLHPRGPDAWYESTVETIYFTESMWQFKVLKAAWERAKEDKKVPKEADKVVEAHRGDCEHGQHRWHEDTSL